jgi:hypothetical protein
LNLFFFWPFAGIQPILFNFPKKAKQQQAFPKRPSHNQFLFLFLKKNFTIIFRVSFIATCFSSFKSLEIKKNSLASIIHREPDKNKRAKKKKKGDNPRDERLHGDDTLFEPSAPINHHAEI